MLGFETLWSPKAAFAKVKQTPTGNWLVPGLVLFGLVTAIGSIHLFRIDITAEMREIIEVSMAEQGQEMPEELERWLPAMAWGQVIFGLLVFPVMLLVMGFVNWLLAKIFKGDGTFGQALGVAVRAKTPALLLTVIGVIIALLMTEPPGFAELAGVVAHHPAALLGVEITSPWFTLSSFFGVFAIWSIVLLIVGCRDALGIPVVQAAASWIVFYCVLAFGLSGLAFLGQAAQAAG